MQKIVDMMLAIIPGVNATESERQRFYIYQFIFNIIVIICFLITYGHFNPYIPGIADMKIEKIEKKIDSLDSIVRSSQLSSMRTEIFTLRKNQCLARTQGNRDAMRYFSQRLSEALAGYKSATGTSYDLPDCSEI